jgi:hypothetical protein
VVCIYLIKNEFKKRNREWRCHLVDQLEY